MSIPQQKILRVLKLIGLLKGRSRKTVQELADTLETSDKSIYRYLKLLEELGFAVDKDVDNHYFIAVWDEGDTPAFSNEESGTLMDLMQQLKGHPLRHSIMGKLQLKTETGGVANQIYKAGLSKHVSRLTTAIDSKLQAVLKRYQSPSSKTVADRLVEPFAFSHNGQYVLGYELESGKSKHFKLERIGEVQLTEKKHKHSKQHQTPEADIFGMSSIEPVQVELLLQMRPALLLKEEYPNAEPFLQKDGDNYILRCPVGGFGGVARFILSNLGEVQIISPLELRIYILEKIERAVI